MASDGKRVDVYLACFHSVKPANLSGCERQYLAVETAISVGEWPYDNGDDPSFYVARRGGPLTWGVCRQDLRNPIRTNSIVVFFSFTPSTDDAVLYRLCAVATVADKIDHRAIHRDHRFSQHRQLYINGLITPENNGWRYDESDREPSQRHSDWLWRMAENAGIKKETFDKKNASIYANCWFPDSIVGGKLRLGLNYVVFSTAVDRTYIAPHPPLVAKASKGQKEEWTAKRLRALTIGVAARRHAGGRDYLRAANPTGRNLHRHIHFEMPAQEAAKWRAKLILALRASEGHRKFTSPQSRPIRNVRC